MIRIGAPILEPWETPRQWAEAAVRLGYRAVYCPITPSDPRADQTQTIQDFVHAAADHDLMIAEVGVWHTNLISPDPAERKHALAQAIAGLRLADQMGLHVQNHFYFLTCS